jgi:YidC/Oxa1 family membrane protein insertase
MYDRKTWIVVALCSVLLAVNLYFSSKNRQDLDARRQKETPGQTVSQTPAKTADGTTQPTGSMAEVDPPEQEAEIFWKLETPEAIFTFSSVGGGLKTVQIKNQTNGLLGPVILNNHGASPIGAIAEGPDRMEATNYTVVDKESVKDKSVVFRGKLPSGLWAKKTWSLVEDGNEGNPYMLDFKLQIENGREDQVNLDGFSLFLGTATPLDTVERGEQTGFVLNDARSFSFHSVSEFAKAWFGLRKERSLITEPIEKTVYAGVANQFFATVVRPMEPGASLLWSKVETTTLKPDTRPVKTIRAGLRLPEAALSPGDQRTLTYQVFTGPKQNRILRKMEDQYGGEWGTLMNYGFFSPFSRFMNWSLWWVHAGMSKISDKWSWGLAVIVLTILLRTAIWPLYNRSNRTMKRMSKLKPEMDKLREKYPDDPQKMNQEMMGLYRKYGINPLGGCLPMFAQLPIFFGFYSMLLHAVEMRGQSFLWVDDLSQPDTVAHLLGLPINPLPIVMAITSFAQMAMMPNTGGDKTQMMMIKFMPFFVLFICYNFASALALYWTTSNIFSIAQTWLSNRLPEPELKAKAGGGKSFMERMVEKQAEMERMKQARGRVVDPGSGGDGGATGKKRPPRTGG